GGWYDHVSPPQVDPFGYGFRVPSLLVSPYAKKGFIDHTQLDFTSQLKFIEDNWGLQPLADRDQQANSLATAFDFAQAPRQPALVGDTRAAGVVSEHNRDALYPAYGGSILVFIVLFALCLRRRRKVVEPVVPEKKAS